MDHLSFHLNHAVVDSYASKPVPWGFPVGGGNSLGELTFLTKYSRLKPNGTKERWHETCERVINGMYSILQDHCVKNRTPWDETKAQESAAEAFDRLFHFKWTPPGRGLWMMGTEFVTEQGSAALQNCAFVSTFEIDQDSLSPFTLLMEMSMLGIGVGFDTRGAGLIEIVEPGSAVQHSIAPHVIPDSREGWVDSLRLVLAAYFKGWALPVFDYSLIRPAGEPIKGFGGVAAGPEPLIKLHTEMRRILDSRIGERISSRTITDIMNMIGKCVVAGNVRRSAEIAFGFADDKDFVSLKDWTLPVNDERMDWANGWGHLSNNSIFAETGENYDHLVERIAVNGEPGLMYLDLARSHGRLSDPADHHDHRVMGANPCVEQSLEHLELCTLVETFPTHHESVDDYKRTLKFAYLYGKAVTLLPTHWPQVNEVMTRNRRIGASMTGVAQFVELHGWQDLRRWADAGYEEIQRRDTQYSEWLGVRESIKTTSVKPSGTVSILAGVTPGVHWPTTSGAYLRRIRYSIHDATLPVVQAAGFHVEPDVNDPENTVVVTFPVTGPEIRDEREVTVWEKMQLAALMQAHWADNMVSATFSFRTDEADQVGHAIHSFDGRLKSMSFLPMADESVYQQMPYEEADVETVEGLQAGISRVDTEALYGMAIEAVGEKYCDNDSCEII